MIFQNGDQLLVKFWTHYLRSVDPAVPSRAVPCLSEQWENTLGSSVGQSSRLGLLYKLVFRPHSHLKVGTSFTEGWLPSLAGSPFPKGQGQHSRMTTLRVHNPPETHWARLFPGARRQLTMEFEALFWNKNICSGISCHRGVFSMSGCGRCEQESDPNQTHNTEESQCTSGLRTEYRPFPRLCGKALVERAGRGKAWLSLSSASLSSGDRRQAA